MSGKMKISHLPLYPQWPGTDPPTVIDSFSDSLAYEIEHWNLYAYTYISPFENLTLTVGASGDFYDEDGKKLW